MTSLMPLDTLHKQAFGKNRRLLNAFDYDNVFQNTIKRQRNRDYIWLASLAQTPLQHTRLGLIISKKSLARSVDRSYVKRQIRELFRTTDLPTGWNIVFRTLHNYDVKALQASKQKTDNNFWKNNVKSGFNKLINKLNTTNIDTNPPKTRE